MTAKLAALDIFICSNLQPHSLKRNRNGATGGGCRLRLSPLSQIELFAADVDNRRIEHEMFGAQNVREHLGYRESGILKSMRTDSERAELAGTNLIQTIDSGSYRPRGRPVQDVHRACCSDIDAAER